MAGNMMGRIERGSGIRVAGHAASAGGQARRRRCPRVVGDGERARLLAEPARRVPAPARSFPNPTQRILRKGREGGRKIDERNSRARDNECLPCPFFESLQPTFFFCLLNELPLRIA